MASRRGYLSQAELAQYADITILDSTEADDQISQAEEIIDAYVGFQEKFISQVYHGVATSGGASTLVDTSSDTPLTTGNINDFFTRCCVEIIGGTGAGQRRIITAYNATTQTLTVDAAWATNPDSTSAYKIFQLGKFPRRTPADWWFDSTGQKYYKSIPEAVIRAVAAQLEFMINQGAAFFASDSSDYQSETIGNYSYSKGAGSANAAASVKLIAPKAKALLKGIKNSTGRLVADQTTY